MVTRGELYRSSSTYSHADTNIEMGTHRLSFPSRHGAEVDLPQEA
jgi:hypothetical protein